MAQTQIQVDADDFVLCCPSCNDPIEVITITRMHQFQLTCESCYEDANLVITLEQ